MTMQMCPGPSCPDCPFSTELGDRKINTRIRGVLAPGAEQNPGFSPVPLREKVDNPWVSLLYLAFSYLCHSSFLNIDMFLSRVSGVPVAPREVPPYPRVHQGGWPTMSVANGYGHRGKLRRHVEDNEELMCS
jgi:hypothetical protein